MLQNVNTKRISTAGQTAYKLFSKVKKALQHLEEVVVYPDEEKPAANDKKVTVDQKD